ncbi:MAG: SDR family oxidoreductase [Pseudomonadota bacterium]
MTQSRLSEKFALITGAASGIGAATARRFVDEGAKVLLADLQTERAQQLANELGPKATSVHLDVRSEDSWRDAMQAAESLGELTTVVNSAGISIPGSIEDVTLEGFRNTLAINLEGVFLGCKFAVASLKGVRGASIINVASTLGVQSGALFAAYSASKGGVRLLSKSVALHCAEQGYDVRVNCILPGAIHTEMVEGYVAAGEQAGQTRDAVLNGFASGIPMSRLGRPDEPANAIVFLASDESSFTSGGELAVDGAMLA